MRETWEKQKSDFIEVTGKYSKNKIIINKKEIERVSNNEYVEIKFIGGHFMDNNRNTYHINVLTISETYEKIKELLGM